MRPTLAVPLLAFLTILCVPGAALGQASPAWQQRVRYEMDVTLLADRHQMRGRQRLTYFNHSPDTLRQVFYHLYFNAFQPGSMMAERNRHLPDPDPRIVPRIWNLGPDEVGYHRVESLRQNGRAVAFEVHDTVLRAALAEAILPGDSAVFEMAFRSQVPLQTRRSGRDNREGVDYSMSQWYPKMAAYDSRGWHADPYVGREFYAPFGTFDVRLKLPAPYVVGATGVLQNPDEIGHGYQTDSTAVYTYEPADSLTWHFYAEDVHDFAWAADPDYLHDRIEGDDGVMYHLLYLPDVAPVWQTLRAGAPALMQALGRLVGPYPYPQFTVAQAGDGGMEYPMVNFITGRRSPGSLLGVTAHEGAHEWFYGVLGSNEADYSWMDEGFTSYASARALAEVQGRPAPSGQGNVLAVLSLQHNGLADRLNTPADWYETNAAFGVASYPGGAMIADLLGYVVSDSLRDAWLQAYFRRFAFRHPNPFDVEKVAEDVSGLQLDWFFEQFANTTRPLDYAVAGLDGRRSGGGWQTSVTLRRLAPAVVPIDLRLTLEDGATQWVNIPLSIMEGHKPVPEGWMVAAPWPWTFPDYTLTVELPQRVVRAEIDPLGRTPDRNRLNNTSGFPVQARFLQPPQQAWHVYSVGYRPLAGYADAYGAGVGAQLRGAYLFGDHHLLATLTLWPETIADPGDASFLDGIDYTLRYRRLAPAFGPGATLEASAAKHLGILENRIDFSKDLASPLSRTARRLTASLIYQHRTSDRAFNDVFSPVDARLWSRSHLFSMRLAYGVSRGADRLEMALEVGGAAGLPATDDLGTLALGDKAGLFSLRAAKTAAFGPFTGRALLTLAAGNRNLAPQKQRLLGAAPLEDQWRSAAFRSLAAAAANPLEDLHLVPFSDAGPVGYLLSDVFAEGGASGLTFLRGSNLAAGTLTLSVAPFAGNAWLRPLAAEVFSGAGTVWEVLSEYADADVVADAGFGVSYDVAALRPLRRWIAQSDVLAGLHLVARFPVWVSDPALIAPDEDAVAFRWLVGVRTGL